ncbi:hypothetical protein LEP1GSC036_3861 [Leptospira weilii str. 2006001853]|uniref:Uncharacterized protein n=4 Tax=Leptospira weilii TaxID=28184 RepID=A0A828Z3U2_9LEPT|nr:hypothetical protein LEP1GSC036_3861 [Leptospira weilii str. 2006001853]EMJ65286.1 hypothetical protein LEP1GSC051_3971 [Leptospira sp. P2653]EMM72602.1 hypothetical protein LEP1GSC038_1916 [Leptospira weilii str. 2006001855]EMN43734.1 hypothetical protein LEP1GSC086_4553 [Leptospira weilii str. LNT 1234]EMN90017.1 hypothetical protein LEP1GSC108_4899 [Leptospira weilii str. UI 13098]EMY15427.1 hypothetical protein LEP1GSC043_0586 [Leptospira weilii str. Ecochallenge]
MRIVAPSILFFTDLSENSSALPLFMDRDQADNLGFFSTGFHS